MEGPKVFSYFKTYRLESGLTQKDLTFLLSLKSCSAISRIEKNIQRPTLKIVMAYCNIFSADVDSLVPTLSDDINKSIIKRAPLLANNLEKQPKTSSIEQRIAFLNDLLLGRKQLV
ncbi:MAG: helix-turn-helix domain-containing protein [Deltaproteobacteria bacterium]|nr:helix-turn-helix domain-containing protein [Deltaproteobacteria bacterium]